MMSPATAPVGRFSAFCIFYFVFLAVLVNALDRTIQKFVCLSKDVQKPKIKFRNSFDAITSVYCAVKFAHIAWLVLSTERL